MKEQRLKQSYLKVKRVEVNEKHIALRVILFFVFLSIAIAGFTIGVIKWTDVKEGWHLIDTGKKFGADCSDDFSFYYYISGNRSNRKDTKNLVTNSYAELCSKYLKIFDESNEYENVNNVKTINSHINEDIIVDKDLYNSLKAFKDNNSRMLYYAPVIDLYYNLFNQSSTDVDSSTFDPTVNSELNEMLKEITSFVKDNTDIDLKLLDENKVRLEISDDYKNYCNANNIQTYIDFGYLKNAFIIDLIENEFVNHGYIDGYITSTDGYSTIFTEREISSKIRNLDGLVITDVGNINLKNRVNIVEFLPFFENAEGRLYYIYNKDKYVTTYVNEDGISSCLHKDLLFYSEDVNVNCVDILFKCVDIFIDDTLDTNKIIDLLDDKINTIYSENNKIYISNENTKIFNVAQGYNVEKIK